MEKTIKIGSETGIGSTIVGFFDKSQNWAALSLGSFLALGVSPSVRNLYDFVQSIFYEPTHGTYLEASLEVYVQESLPEIGLFLFGLYSLIVFVILYIMEKNPVSVSSPDSCDTNAEGENQQ